MKKATIDAIIGLAVSAFNKKSKPGEFARIAAHRAALDAAKEYNPDLADFAALNAAAVFYVEITEAINFTAQVTDKSVTLVGAKNNYQALWDNFARTILPTKISADYFEQLAQAPDKISRAFIENVAPTYDTTSVLDTVARNKAKRAALYVYLDTYAVCRMTYIRALFHVQNYPGADKLATFQCTISRHLNKELTYDIIYPFFLYRILNSTIFKALTSLVLFASIAGVFIAIFHLTVIPFVPLIAASSGGSAATLGLLTGSFFASKKCRQIALANDNRAENAQVI